MCCTLINDEGTEKSPLLLFMISSEKLIELANQYIDEIDGLFLVEASIKGTDGSMKVTVLLDGDKGVNVDDCASVSRQLGNYLEENELFEDKYRLVVSSAGIEQPLKFNRQYVKNIGRDLYVKLKDGEEIQGQLVEVGDQNFVIKELIEEPKMAKKYKDEDVVIAFALVNKTKVLISFN